jgi:hypothetical protein
VVGGALPGPPAYLFFCGPNFGELRKNEVRRISIPRTPVNKGRKKGRSCDSAPIPGRNATSLVPSGQLQRREIDIGFVGLGFVKGTTAVPAKPP